MAIEEEDHQQQQQQTKRIMASEPSEDSQLAPPLLPVEMIVEILKRLPVESLLRFRCVCKSWCSIISDPRFVKSHLTYSTTNFNHYAHHRLIFRTESAIMRIKSCPLYDVLYGGSVNNASELDNLQKHPLNYVSIVGSCNGLFIWNPSTRRSIRLPNYDIKVGCDRREMYGFGYDAATDDYKVVGIPSVLRIDSNGVRYEYDTIVNIYTLKTRYWKKLDFLHNCPTWDFSITILNGACHWVADRGLGSASSWRIVTLDLAKETYGEILPPEYDKDDKNFLLTLGAVGELLCVFNDYVSIRMDVWVMKVTDSWTKLVSIPYMNDPYECENYYSVPLCISNDGKILLQLGSKLVVYDSKDRSSSEIQNLDKCIEAYTLVESLVSPGSPVGSEDNNDG